MNKCKICGKPCQDTLCLDHRYRNGGRLSETEETGRDTLTKFLEYQSHPFRAGFTPDQLQQVSPCER